MEILKYKLYGNIHRGRIFRIGLHVVEEVVARYGKSVLVWGARESVQKGLGLLVSLSHPKCAKVPLVRDWEVDWSAITGKVLLLCAQSVGPTHPKMLHMHVAPTTCGGSEPAPQGYKSVELRGFFPSGRSVKPFLRAGMTITLQLIVGVDVGRFEVLSAPVEFVLPLRGKTQSLTRTRVLGAKKYPAASTTTATTTSSANSSKKKKQSTTPTRKRSSVNLAQDLRISLLSSLDSSASSSNLSSSLPAPSSAPSYSVASLKHSSSSPSLYGSIRQRSADDAPQQQLRDSYRKSLTSTSSNKSSTSSQTAPDVIIGQSTYQTPPGSPAKRRRKIISLPPRNTLSAMADDAAFGNWGHSWENDSKKDEQHFWQPCFAPVEPPSSFPQSHPTPAPLVESVAVEQQAVWKVEEATPWKAASPKRIETNIEPFWERASLFDNIDDLPPPTEWSPLKKKDHTRSSAFFSHCGAPFAAQQDTPQWASADFVPHPRSPVSDSDDILLGQFRL